MSEIPLTRDDVHEALAHLYDNDLLAHSRLATSFPRIRDVLPIEKRADQMRALLLEAIEVLRPSRRRGFGSAESRHYDVLCLRYVENSPVSRMTQELSFSRRQIHRDLLEAESRLAEVLESRLGANAGLDAPREIDPLTSELLVLRSQPAQVELLELVQSALRLLKPLAEQLGVSLQLLPGCAAPIVAVADGALLKQVLIQLAGHAIRAAEQREVSVSLNKCGQNAEIAIRFVSASSSHLAGLKDAQRIAFSQQIPCEIKKDAEGGVEVLLLLRGGDSRSVLVVEDNEGAVALYRRYLAGSAWQVRSVPDPRLAREAAASDKPDVIILDIMMPTMDGWSVLESLLGSPETAGIPVLICSVVEDIQLGKALGARAYLKKPVSRGELLSALGRYVQEGRSS